MINENFCIQTDQLSFTFVEGSKPEFLMNSKRGLVEIVYPPHTIFNTPQMQTWLFKVVIEALRKQAKLILPERLQELARQMNLSLTEPHLTIINTVRSYYAEYAAAPPMRGLIQLLKKQGHAGLADSITLASLFPDGAAKSAAKLAGLPKPVHCI